MSLFRKSEAFLFHLVEIQFLTIAINVLNTTVGVKSQIFYERKEKLAFYFVCNFFLEYLRALQSGKRAAHVS